jgi:hypothetical protein
VLSKEGTLAEDLKHKMLATRHTKKAFYSPLKTGERTHIQGLLKTGSYIGTMSLLGAHA